MPEEGDAPVARIEEMPTADIAGLEIVDRNGGKRILLLDAVDKHDRYAIGFEIRYHWLEVERRDDDEPVDTA